MPFDAMLPEFVVTHLYAPRGQVKEMLNNKKIRKIFAFANNHYAGHGPGTVKLFVDLWDKKQ